MKAAALALLVAASTSVHSAPPPAAATGAWWKKTCSSQLPDEYLQCVSFVTGVVLGTVQQASTTKTALPFCVPENVTFFDLTKIFRQFMDTHPDKVNAGSATIVTASLMLAYPCPSGH